MAIYVFSNPDNPSETVEVVQGMNDKHVYFGEDGKEWNRVFFSPQIAQDTRIDPYSAEHFKRKTERSKTVGDLFDMSKEMSDMRADKNGGVDKIREKAEKKFYKKK